MAREAIHTGFLRYAGFRWAKVALLLCAVSIAAYLWHSPADGPNGGSWLGYTLGTIAGLLVLWLLWLGVRKRSYRSSLGSVRGWASAHVYLGLALVVVATLHAGFQLGLNIHSLAYVLVLLVVASGIWGIAAYASLPERISRLREGSTREAWIAEVFDLNDQAIRLADSMGPEVHQRIVASAEKLPIGGGFWQQWRGTTPSSDGNKLRELLEQRMAKLRNQPAFDPNSLSTVSFMASQLQARPEQDLAQVQQLLELLSQRNALIARINQDISLHARLQLWLLLHVPISLALLAALLAHVLSVFFYW